jgi:hypothetical protein
MGDLKNPKAIYFKGLLFLVTGLLSATLLLIENASWKNALFLGLAIWCFCRFYFFAFYVIEHYVDKQYRFAGLFDFLKYLSKKNR